MKKIKISEIDKKHYAIIRKSVTNSIKSLTTNFDKKNKIILDIAPQDHENSKRYFKKAIIKTLDIDPLSGADYVSDICKKNKKIESNYFDLIICTEVLEHTLNPFNATKEIYRILKKGGTVLVTTPLNFRIHGPLPDCWRFTEYGIRELFKNFSKITIKQIKSKNRNFFLFNTK